METLLSGAKQIGPAFPGLFLPVALLFILAEYLYGKLSGHTANYQRSETAATIGVAIGDVFARVLTGAIAAMPFFFLYTHRLFDISLQRPWTWLALFFGVEFAYYWFHRASHRVRWLWATHATHHSATHSIFPRQSGLAGPGS